MAGVGSFGLVLVLWFCGVWFGLWLFGECFFGWLVLVFSGVVVFVGVFFGVVPMAGGFGEFCCGGG